MIRAAAARIANSMPPGPTGSAATPPAPARIAGTAQWEPRSPARDGEDLRGRPRSQRPRPGPCTRDRGSLAGAEFASNVMPAGGGRLALSVSKGTMAASHLAVGDQADLKISGVGSGSPRSGALHGDRPRT